MYFKLYKTITLVIVFLATCITPSYSAPTNTTIDDHSHRISYIPEDAWNQLRDDKWAAEYVDSTCSYTTTPQASFLFNFTGIEVALYVPTLSEHANRVVIFDGNRSDLLSISTGEEGISQQWWTSGRVPYGQHSIEVIHMDEREGVPLAVDSIRVLDDPDLHSTITTSKLLATAPLASSSLTEVPSGGGLTNDSLKPDKMMALMIVLPLLITLILCPLGIILYLKYRRRRSSASLSSLYEKTVAASLHSHPSLQGITTFTTNTTTATTTATTVSPNVTETHLTTLSNASGAHISLMPHQLGTATRGIPHASLPQPVISSVQRDQRSGFTMAVAEPFSRLLGSISLSRSPTKKSSGTRRELPVNDSWSLRSSYDASLFTTTATAMSETSGWGSTEIGARSPISVYGTKMNYNPQVAASSKESDRKSLSDQSFASTRNSLPMSDFGTSLSSDNPFSNLNAVPSINH